MTMQSPEGFQTRSEPSSPAPRQTETLRGSLDTSEPFALPSQPEDPDAITPAPPTFASSSATHRASRASIAPQISPYTTNARQAYSTAAWSSESMPHLAPLLNRPCSHPLNWTMPTHHALFSTFIPSVATSILNAGTLREGKCFCALALHAAQIHVSRTTTINLSHRPMNVADYFATLSRFLTQPSVDVFVAACERYEELYGSGSADPYVQQHTIVEFVGGWLEELARDGTTIAVEEEQDAGQQKVLQAMVESRPGRWRRVKASLKKVGERIQFNTYRSRHDSVATPGQNQQQRWGRSNA